MYLELVSKYKEQHRFKLYSYNMLPDHVELLIETGDDASISEIMHDLNSLYTKYYNGRYHRRGHLFESRFRSVLVEKANYLLAVTRKIHRASLDNAYSSFHIYRATGGGVEDVDRPRLDMRAEVAEVLGFLKEKDDPDAYELYVLKGEKTEIEELEKSLRRGPVLGSDAFKEQVREELERRAKEQKQEKRPGRPGPVVIAMVGAMVLVATSTSVYLFISKQTLQQQVTTLLERKESEFAERSNFENRSPLAPTDLEGTVWEIETVPMLGGGVVQQDKLTFKDGRFSSEALAAQGFRSGSYILIPKGGGVVFWQSAQSDPQGNTVAWQGTWQGEAMKGTYTLRRRDTAPQGFSFFSLRWSS